jgi:excisionase family DNA binding protein
MNQIMGTAETPSNFGTQTRNAKTSRDMLGAILAAAERIAIGVEQLVAQRAHPGHEPNAALSTDEAAQYLGVPMKTLLYLIRRRKIRYVKVGEQRGRVFRRQDLERYLEENTLLTAQEMLGKRRSPRR